MEQDRVYTISTGMKIFYSALGVIMVGFSFFILKNPPAQPNLFLLLIPAVIVAGAALIFINLIKRRVIISDTGITNINVFTNKTLSFSDIKGCRIGQKILTLESISADTPNITIGNYSDLGDSEQLAGWVRETFKDLDAIDLKQDEESILQDSTLGFSEEDRSKKLKIAKQIALAYNIIGPVISFAFLLLHNGLILIIIGIIYPLIAVPVMKFNHGLIKFLGNSKRSVTSFIVIGFMMPVIFLLVVSITDYQLFDYSHLWTYVGIISAAVFISIYFTGLNKTINGIVAQTIFMIVIAVIYGFGSSTSINCAFDDSKPKIYIAKVLDHRIESGRHTSYLLTLSEWGPMHREKEEDVGKWIYDNVPIGDSVRIYFRPGKLNAPWYQVHSFAYQGK